VLLQFGKREVSLGVEVGPDRGGQPIECVPIARQQVDGSGEQSGR
jgi:hypothetical protein